MRWIRLLGNKVVRMLTEILAIYAAAVSTCSLAISYFTYQSGGPRLSGQALLTGRFSDAEGPMLNVAVYNRGRGPVTIDRIFLWTFAHVKAGPAHALSSRATRRKASTEWNRESK
jgi:hypothetical protein